MNPLKQLSIHVVFKLLIFGVQLKLRTRRIKSGRFVAPIYSAVLRTNAAGDKLISPYCWSYFLGMVSLQLNVLLASQWQPPLSLNCRSDQSEKPDDNSSGSRNDHGT